MAKLTKQDADEIIRVFSNRTPIKIEGYRGGELSVEFDLADGREAIYYSGNNDSLRIQKKKGYTPTEKIAFSDFSIWQQIRLTSFFNKIIKADRARDKARAVAYREASSERGVKLLSGPANEL